MPNWINQLSNPTIAADMSAADMGGMVSYAGMQKLFTDVIAQLNTSHSTLSASQFADLQTIAANLNLGETASGYLQYIIDALADGNIDNANWHGGTAIASPLGNLAVGSSATQLTELVNKWFGGQDLPSLANNPGLNASSIFYSTTGGNLFGPSGPQMSDINQGQLGDCYLCASLAEVAQLNPAVIESMIASNGNNTYSVRFFVDGVAQYITVNNQLPDGGTLFDSGPALWGSLIEKAYAQLQAGGDLTGGSTHYYGNAYATIGAGGYPWYTLEEITGATSLVNFVPSYSHNSWLMETLGQNLVTQVTNSGNSTQAVLMMLMTDLANGNDVVLSSQTSAHDANGKLTLVASHAFSIYGYDSVTGLLELRNPWGSQANQNWNTTFEVSLASLLADGDVITVDNLNGLGSGSQVNNALVSSLPNDQASASITAVTISDSVANVSEQLSALVADSKLVSITLTDANPVLTITSSALIEDSSVLQKIGGTFSVVVTGSNASNLNTMYYSDILANYTINVLGNSINEVKHLVNGNGPVSDTTCTNVQRLQFSDTMVALDTGPTQTAGSAYMLYQAAFNRTPDAAGLGYWIAQLDKGANIITTVAQSFLNSPEFIAQYGTNPSNATYVNDLYQNVLHRSGDAGGIAYWNGQLNSGAASKAFVLEQFATLPEGAADVASAIAHGIHYTQWVG